MVPWLKSWSAGYVEPLISSAALSLHQRRIAQDGMECAERAPGNLPSVRIFLRRASDSVCSCTRRSVRKDVDRKLVCDGSFTIASAPMIELLCIDSDPPVQLLELPLHAS